MQLGWIDFSKTERNKVLSVLDMLSEAGTLDELGIAPVRDGFSNYFFPGTRQSRQEQNIFLLFLMRLSNLKEAMKQILLRYLISLMI